MQAFNSNPQLEEANKYIFVKAYDRAAQMIEELIRQSSFSEDLLLHLRRIELATKLENLDDLRKVYESQIERESLSLIPRIALILVELNADLIDNKEALLRFQSLLRTLGPHPGIYYGIAYCMELEGNLERARFNYEQCINQDPRWYPAYFGLSQIHYQTHDEKKGDQYFFLFEEMAPFNVYGNFETHRRLSQDFLERHDYESAEIAIQTLAEWWVENKGFCPPEIQLFERLATAKIAEIRGDLHIANQRFTQASMVARRIVDDDTAPEGVLYFSAKVLEEFSEFELAVEIYKRLLKAETTNPEMIQKIGGQFLSMGEIHLAHELFSEAYKTHPDQPEIRFCLLVSKLKIHKTNVEDYLISKERLKKLVDQPSDRVELLSLLHSLVSKFPDDPDVHAHMGDVYLRLGNKEKAAKHFKRMHELDSLSRISTLKYAAFAMQFGDIDQAQALLAHLDKESQMSEEELCELLWLQANYEFRKGDAHKGLDRLHRVLERDPWNIAYLILQTRLLSEIAKEKTNLECVDGTLKKLADGDESQLNWEEYDTKTKQLAEVRQIELVYARQKLRFLYAEGGASPLSQLLLAAQAFSPQQGIFDLIKLLNTNFDCPEIYSSLGTLCKELWQLEAASMWFDQMLMIPKLSDSQRAKAYVEQADCYIWRGTNLEKAVEYAKLALDLGLHKDKKPLRVLAHGLLKVGKVRQAEVYLEDSEGDTDPEVIYLRGLVKYRNGAFQAANEVWKPLLTHRTESLRFHNIKQEIMRYYFDREPYRGVN